MLNEWHSKISECILNRINTLKKKKPVRRNLQIIKNPAHLEHSEQFHQKYVLVPADKASNNIIVVCKKFYVDVIINEMRNTDQRSTYVSSTNSHDQLIRKHIMDMQRWNIISPVMERLLPMYWLPKLHKTPYGSRFIAASNICSTKPLSRLLTRCLTTTLIHYKEYYTGIYRNTGVNCFWVISNAQSVLQSMCTLNDTSAARCLDTFDFSTFYTSIPHNSSKSSMKELIQDAFKVRGALY